MSVIPNKHSLPKRFKQYLPFVLILTAVAARLIPGPRIIDDAYITYRYARNILSGHGFVYNPGEILQGTTTPLYTLILTFLASISGGSSAPFPQIAWLFNTLCGALTVYLIWKIGRKLQTPFSGLFTALFWAVAPYSVTFAIGGLETSFFVLLLTLAVYLYLQDRTRWVFLISALSLIARPDALLLAGLMFLDRIYSFYVKGTDGRLPSPRWKTFLSELSIFLLPLVLWFGFAWLYFGTPIPHSVTAKSQAYSLPSLAAFIRFLQHYGTPFMGHHLLGTFWIGVGLILYPWLFTLGLIHTIKINPRIRPWAAYPWIYLLSFAVANPLIFRWYLTPPLLPYAFFILAGLEHLLTREINSASKFILNRDKFRYILLMILLLAPSGLSLHAWTLSPDHGPSRPAPEMAFIKLELIYQQAADVVANDLPRSSQADQSNPPHLAAGDVGVLGYQSGLPILDLVGLNSAQTVTYYPLQESDYIIN